MTKVVLVFALMLSLSAYPQSGSNSPDYTINIHVSASRIGVDCSVAKGDSACKSVQQLTVLIDGLKYELESETFFPKGVVALGDYKAKLTDDKQKPTREFTKTYDLMFPDGSTRKFRVIGQTE